MAQHGQNGNCFCSRAAMRRQQARFPLRHFFVRPLTILPILHHTTSRLHGSVIVPAFDATERAPAEPLFENPLRPQGKSVPKTPKQKPISANK
jgi:hypothetical protein